MTAIFKTKKKNIDKNTEIILNNHKNAKNEQRIWIEEIMNM